MSIHRVVHSKLIRSGINEQDATVIASLWSRWFDTLALVTEKKPMELFNAAPVDILNLDEITSRLGTSLDIPACMADVSDAIPLLSTKEKIQYLADNYDTYLDKLSVSAPAKNESVLYPTTSLSEMTRGRIILTRNKSSHWPVFLSTDRGLDLNNEMASFDIPHGNLIRVLGTYAANTEQFKKALSEVERAGTALEQVEAILRIEHEWETDDLAPALFTPFYTHVRLPNETTIVFDPACLRSALTSAEINALEIGRDNTLYTPLPDNYSHVLFQYAGVKSNHSNHNLLSIAKQLVAEGSDPETVRKLTGWHKWVDGKWRFEIDDSESKIDTSSFHRMTSSRQLLALETKEDLTKLFNGCTESDIIKNTGIFKGSLSEVLNHDLLYQHYPMLRDIPVTVILSEAFPHNTASGYFTGSRIHARSFSIRRLRHLLLHEVQHAIQSIEKFGRGGSAAEFSPLSDVQKRGYQKLHSGFKAGA